MKKRLTGEHKDAVKTRADEAAKLFEKIEDEYDIGVFNAAYNEYEEGGKQSRPIEELWKELEL